MTDPTLWADVRAWIHAHRHGRNPCQHDEAIEDHWLESRRLLARLDAAQIEPASGIAPFRQFTQSMSPSSRFYHGYPGERVSIA